jgi:SAM-dependent methyltransferase
MNGKNGKGGSHGTTRERGTRGRHGRNGKNGAQNGKGPPLTRESADRHLLYQWSVQNPEGEIEFIDRVYRKKHGRKPVLLREDFCGTAYTACEWVKTHPRRRAIALDLDRRTLEWAREHNLAPLGKARERIDLRVSDVRAVTVPRADVVAALNFSYYVFKTFAELESYFRRVLKSLAPGGVFVLDTYGGWESQQVKEEPRKVESPRGRFRYIWHQAEYNPIDNSTRCHIHFELPGGERWERAFTYDWRLYTPAEVRDALLAAGFRAVEIYWDHEPDPEKDDIYRLARRAENTPGWLVYVVGRA